MRGAAGAVSYTHLDVYKRQILYRIVYPMCKPVLTTIMVLVFIGGWNDLNGPLLYLQESTKYTLSIGLQMFLPTARQEWDCLLYTATNAIVREMDNVCKALPCGELLQHCLLIGYGIALTQDEFEDVMRTAEKAIYAFIEDKPVGYKIGRAHV